VHIIREKETLANMVDMERIPAYLKKFEL